VTDPALRKYFALTYQTVPDHAERRTPFRAEHLALARAFLAEGKLVMGGAFNPIDGALLIFRAASPAEVEAFVRQDPYVTNGLVTAWRIQEWTVVVGG
jgi:uncharacterized protein YciI